MYKRVQYQTITKRLKEPRHFLQVVLGPRQVGKTTVIKQVVNDTLTKATNLVLKGAKIEKYKKCLTSTNSPDILYDCCDERKQHGFLKRNSKNKKLE